MLNGKCLCGSVHYEVEDRFRYSLNCHCSKCRRATGGAFKPFAGIERERLKIIDGADRLLVFGQESAHDAHIFVESKAPWYTITDDLPQYEGLP
jgi:hypothetical protein